MKKLLLFLMLPIICYSQIQIGQDIDGEGQNDISGISVSLSSDGNITAIGSNSGQVRVYENINNNWILIGQDINGELESSSSASSISLSSDGNIIAIGTQGNDDNGSNSGQVRVYENINNNWIQIGQDINGVAIGDLLGFNVSLSSDGSIIAISAPGNDDNGQNSGHVRIYENINNNWVQIGEDINGEAQNDILGWSISLSSDGSIIAIGSRFNDTSGDVRVYENQDGNWIQIGNGINAEDIEDTPEIEVSLSSNGSVLAIGFNNSNDIGYVSIYQYSNGDWIQVGENIDGEVQFSPVGSNISLSSDGSKIAIGKPFDNGNDDFSGQVSIYENINNNWVQIGEDINGEEAGDGSGLSINLSSDGNVLAIGAPFNSGNGENSGHVRVFDISNVLSTKESTITNFTVFPNPANSTITISISDSDSLEQAIIYNSLGQKVLESKNSSMDISSLSTGLYLLEVVSSQGKGIQKLLID